MTRKSIARPYMLHLPRGLGPCALLLTTISVSAGGKPSVMDRYLSSSQVQQEIAKVKAANPEAFDAAREDFDLAIRATLTVRHPETERQV